MRNALLIVVTWAVCLTLHAADPHARAEELAAARQFVEAEAEYRQELETMPKDWRLRLGLARVILWSGRYREAEEHFAALLDERPGDEDALLGYAQAAYWWGDFRAARRRYERLRTVDPDHGEAAKVLMDLSALTAGRYDVTATHLDDSQPHQISATRVVVSDFFDPLTQWDVRASIGDVQDGEQQLRSGGAGISAALPRRRLSFRAGADWFRFSNGESEILGEVAMTAKLPWRSAVTLAADRSPLLATAVSVDDNATVIRYRAGWQRDVTERLLAAVNVYALRYSDDNSGSGADAWFLAPLVTRGTMIVRAGLSAAVRDTKLNRFRFTEFESEQIGPAEWRYTYSGVYDPYWTPHDLREARLVVAAEWPRVKIQADGGEARDRALGFGPPTGSTPNPLFILPEMQERSFRPWRAGVEVDWPLRSSFELRFSYRHDVTAFYRANEFQASVGGRL